MCGAIVQPSEDNHIAVERSKLLVGLAIEGQVVQMRDYENIDTGDFRAGISDCFFQISFFWIATLALGNHDGQ
jgi:hypothetical protein